MPIIQFDKKFAKQYKKTDEYVRESFNKKLELFIEHKHSPGLGLHKLHGKYLNCYSININGDWRAIFRELDDGKLIYFIAIGTHSQLYK